MLDQVLTAQQIVNLIPGLGYPALADLVRRGIITPSKRRGVGRGVPSLYDFVDLVAIATVDYVRPKAASTSLMAALYTFWRSAEGRTLVDRAAHGQAERVVVVDGKGRVSSESDASVAALFKTRKATMLTIIEPVALVQGLLTEYTERLMVNPLPSGHPARVGMARPSRRAEMKVLRGMLKDSGAEPTPKKPSPPRRRARRTRES